MKEPPGLKPLGQSSIEMSQIFSLTSYDSSHRQYTKGMYKINTVESLNIDKDKRHTPATSFVQYIFAFNENDELRNEFQTHNKKGIRSSLILNEMDSLALDVSYKYVRIRKSGQKDNFRLVTTVVDRMNFFHKIKPNQNIKMNGYVMYVAQTSIVVGIDLYIQTEAEKWEFLGNATYIIVARTMDNKAYKVPQLSFNGENKLMRCKARFEYGYRIKAE